VLRLDEEGSVVRPPQGAPLLLGRWSAGHNSPATGPTATLRATVPRADVPPCQRAMPGAALLRTAFRLGCLLPGRPRLLHTRMRVALPWGGPLRGGHGADPPRGRQRADTHTLRGRHVADRLRADTWPTD
jgi:hypothetical protein